LPDTIAFVAPWFGPAIPGGAEAECRSTARALQAQGLPVEILTTCALDHASEWRDHHSPGVTEEAGLTVRRFPVSAREPSRYGALQHKMDLGGPLSFFEEEDFVRESINSADLYAYLAAERSRYWYFFIPYCFGTTWSGALAAPDRSLVIPCLHDEPFAHLRWTRRLLRSPRGVCYHVPAEQALGQQLAGTGPAASFLVGEGVDALPPGDAGRFRARHRLDAPFLLYAGRKAREKNVHLLLEYFARYRTAHLERPLQLVMIGAGSLPVPERVAGDVLDLGFVPTQDKADAYAAALALCQPSRLESFSIVMMEAWLAGTPALVHGRCAVTREHCLASGGGLFFDDYLEFAGALDLLLDRPELRGHLGRQGRAYVEARYTWDRVTRNYLDVLAAVGARLP
jgi:glycosyltransferase involved in cell wall biosynthesis